MVVKINTNTVTSVYNNIPDQDQFNEFFAKKEVSNELLWKFLVRITFARSPKETTKSALKTYLNKSDATLTYIFDVLKNFLIEKRRKSLGKRKNEQIYYLINWSIIIDFLIEDTSFDENSKIIVSDYFYNTIHILSELKEQIGGNIQPLEIDQQIKEYIMQIVDYNPRTLFLFLVINYFLSLLSTLENISEISVSSEDAIKFLTDIGILPIPILVLNFITEYYTNYLIKGTLEQLNLIMEGKRISITKKTRKTIVPEGETKEEENNETFDWTELITLLFTGFQVAKPIIENMQEINYDKPISLRIPLKNGTKKTIKVNVGQINRYFSF